MRPFFYKVKITYGITVYNEAAELEALLKTLIRYLKRKDEIVILKDITHPCIEVDAVIEKYKRYIATVLESKLNNDFSAFKNNLINAAKGNYLFQIDADEIPQKSLLIHLKKILKRYYKFDCFSLPRINTVAGFTQAHIDRWHWKVDERGYINYPDYQMRIFKLKTGILWENKVHEILTGFQNPLHLPDQNVDLCLIHQKTIDKQEAQNKFYDTL
ncbi:MAG: glycosyltransferase [Niabella sp.]